MSKAWKIVIAAVVGVIVAIPLGTYVYINFIQDDPPPPLTLSSGPGPAAQIATSTTTAAVVGVTAASTSTTVAATTTAVNYKPTSGSVLGYRVKEVLFGQSNEAVGRTSDITGSMTLNGATVSAVNLTVNMRTVRSDQSQRDGQFNGRIMNTSTYPTATFTLTQPLTLSNFPSDSTVVNAKATGDLTLRGVTKSVTFDLMAQRDGDNVKVNGTIPVVFADYRIPNPSGGPASTEDHGVIEFLLVFEKA